MAERSGLAPGRAVQTATRIAVPAPRRPRAAFTYLAAAGRSAQRGGGRAGHARRLFTYLASGGPWEPLSAGGVLPFADRLQALVRAALERGPLDDAALAREVFGPLEGQASSWPLFQACLHAYGHRAGEGRWALAEAEQAPRVEAWRARMLAGLAALAPRLGYEVGEAPGCDLAWAEAGEARIAFRVQTSARLGEVSRTAPPVSRRVLVVSGRRLALWRHKLAAVPLWWAALEGAGWAFLRDAALAALLEGPAERARFEAALGLEEGSGQLTLFSA